MTGIKFDSQKLRYDLIPPEFLEGLAKTHMVGADKYGEGNWEKGISFERLYSAAMRHMEAFRKGETHDKETGLNHMYHAAWNMGISAVLHERKLKDNITVKVEQIAQQYNTNDKPANSDTEKDTQPELAINADCPNRQSCPRRPDKDDKMCKFFFGGQCNNEYVIGYRKMRGFA